MNKQIVVIGLGRFGFNLAASLAFLGHEVLAIDRSEKEVQAISSQVTHSIQADATSEDILRELGVSNFDIGVVGIGARIENSVLITLLLKKLGVPYIIAKADTETHGVILEKIGANRVVYPERECAVRVAQEITLADVSDYMALTSVYGVAKLEAPEHFVGHQLSTLGFGCEGKWKVAVLAVQRGKEVIMEPARWENIQTDDVLIIAGGHEDIEGLLRKAKEDYQKEGEE